MSGVLVVDGANVVGSRPDGWWRDRPGAARRLRDALAAADLPFDVVLVLEGAARAAEDVPGLRVVRAADSGDDALVAEVRDQVAAGATVTAVTADRALRERLAALGAGLRGPRWLLERL